MADIIVDVREGVKIVSDLIEAHVVEEKKRRQSNQFPSSIYRVPKTLRDVRPCSYSPRVISIGPFHKNDETLKNFQDYKVTYLRDLFRRVKSPRRDTTNDCVKVVLDNIDRIKACYHREVNGFTNYEFAEMMVLDACFILELIYRSDQKIYDSDSFFAKNLLNLYVKLDLVLLENQIPFFVLKDIFRCTIKKFNPATCLVKLILSFLKDLNPFGKELEFDSKRSDTDHDHILALLQKCFHPPEATQSEIIKDGYSAAALSNAISYSITELSLAGVKFKTSKNAEWVLAMELELSRIPFYVCSWASPTFRMPPLHIEDYTESVLRNLIAYEQCSPRTPNYITSYAFAMERLLDTKHDFFEVIDSDVLVNNLGSSKQASDMINSICKEVTVKDFSYTRQWKDLDAYYHGYWPKNVSWLRREYFNTPWSFIALVGALILFGLTVAQTYYTIRPV